MVFFGGGAYGGGGLESGCVGVALGGAFDGNCPLHPSKACIRSGAVLASLRTSTC